eukprot:4370139-Prymnesium_polylepis.1
MPSESAPSESAPSESVPSEGAPSESCRVSRVIHPTRCQHTPPRRRAPCHTRPPRACTPHHVWTALHPTAQRPPS